MEENVASKATIKQQKEASRRENRKQYRLHRLDQKEQKEMTYKNNLNKNQTTFFTLST